MQIPKDILDAIELWTNPGACGQETALERYQEVHAWLESSIEALQQEIEDNEG